MLCKVKSHHFHTSCDVEKTFIFLFRFTHRDVFGSFLGFLFCKKFFLQDSVLNNCKFFPVNKDYLSIEHSNEDFSKPCKRSKGWKAGFALIVRLIVGHSGLTNLKYF